MKTTLFKDRTRALALVEVLIVLAFILMLMALLLPRWANRKARSQRIACVGNLKGVGISFHMWAGDNGDRFPMQVSTSAGGTMELTGPADVYRHFEVMYRELASPKILFCPTESDPTRTRANSFGLPGSFLGGPPVFAGNRNLSYFVGIDATNTYPSAFLSGDRNITNGPPVIGGILELTTNRASAWTGTMHRNMGNISLSDASVQSFNNEQLRHGIQYSGFETNRLHMP